MLWDHALAAGPLPSRLIYMDYVIRQHEQHQLLTFRYPDKERVAQSLTHSAAAFLLPLPASQAGRHYYLLTYSTHEVPVGLRGPVPNYRRGAALR